MSLFSILFLFLFSFSLCVCVLSHHLRIHSQTLSQGVLIQYYKDAACSSSKFVVANCITASSCAGAYNQSILGAPINTWQFYSLKALSSSNQLSITFYSDVDCSSEISNSKRLVSYSSGMSGNCASTSDLSKVVPIVISTLMPYYTVGTCQSSSPSSSFPSQQVTEVFYNTVGASGPNACDLSLGMSASTHLSETCFDPQIFLFGSSPSAPMNQGSTSYRVVGATTLMIQSYSHQTSRNVSLSSFGAFCSPSDLNTFSSHNATLNAVCSNNLRYLAGAFVIPYDPTSGNAVGTDPSSLPSAAARTVLHSSQSVLIRITLATVALLVLFV
jgi:hypothetical protein